VTRVMPVIKETCINIYLSIDTSRARPGYTDIVGRRDQMGLGRQNLYARVGVSAGSNWDRQFVNGKTSVPFLRRVECAYSVELLLYQLNLR
jgi:hypothetical protein